MIPFESWEKSSKEGDRKRRRESVKELRRLGRFRDRPPSATSRRKSTTWVLQPSLPAQKDRLCLPTSRIRLPIPRCYRRAFQISPELNLLQQFNINHLSTTTGSVKIIEAVTQRIEKKNLVLPLGCCRCVTRAWTANKDCSSKSAALSTYFRNTSDKFFRAVLFSLLSVPIP